LAVSVSGGVALAHWLFRFTGKDKEHRAMQTWFRTTAGYRMDQGKWRIVHEHCSVPFDPYTAQAALTLFAGTIHSATGGNRENRVGNCVFRI
jgi:hypothetical protein